MKLGIQIAIWGSISLVAVATLRAVTDDSNPYGRIVERNVFSLRDPPPPPPPPPPPTPKITLQGVTSILGRKQVLFKCQPQGTKEQSYILSEGQREDDIEVLAIDEDLGLIKFNNHGVVQTLSMDKDASKPPAGTAPMPGALPKPIPTASVQKAGVPSTASGGGSGVTSIGSQGLRQIPTRTPRTTTEGSEGTRRANAVARDEPPTMTPEEQEIIIEAHKMKAKEEGDDSAAIYPVTSLTPELESEAPSPAP